MNKLINIAKRLSRSITSKDAQDVYDKIRKDQVLSQMISALNADDFVLLCFLVAANNREMNLEGTIEQFSKFLLSFSMVSIDHNIPEESCSECGGDGSTTCSTCGGDREIDCGECGGSGQDYDGDSCSYCDGDGQISCADCAGDGYESCWDCSGSGTVDANHKVSINVSECITISNHIFNIVESQELQTPIGFKKWDLIMADRETIKLYFYSEDSESFDTDLRGEYMIYETNKSDILLAKQSNGFIRDNFLSDIN